jgi:glycosyltransferase involved in cell wall biosynthesis
MREHMPRAPTVVHVITGLNQGGAEAALYRLILAQPHPTHSVISLTTEGLYAQLLREKGIDVTCMGARSPLGAMRLLPRLTAQLCRLSPDVVQTWLFHADLLGGVAAWRNRIPVVWSMRCSALATEKLATRAVVRMNALLSGRLPHSVVSCSRRGIEVLKEAGYRCRFRYVPNGIDCDLFHPDPAARQSQRASWNIPADDLVFGHVGRGHPIKDHATLLAAFAQLRALRDDTWLVLAGTDLHAESEYLLPLMAQHPSIADRVIALGPVVNIPSVMAALDLHVLASRSEGFPNVIAEAMACAVPCITTDVGEAREMVGSTGWVVPVAEPGKLYEAVLSAASLSGSARVERGLLARERVRAHYSMNSMVDGFNRAWKDAVEAAV